MDNRDFNTLPPWEQLFKRVLWAQIGDLRGKRILDFGSGIGETACHYAAENEVIAVEPSAESVAKRWNEHPYRQIIGSTDAFQELEDGSSADYGAIHYYEDEDATGGFHIRDTYGIRTFWDLQQKQDCHTDPAWQEKMIDMELRVARLQPYRDVAFFHHLILEKE